MSDPIRVFDPAMKLRELVSEAKEKGLWFYQASQGLWYSPEEMEKLLPDNVCLTFSEWELRDPTALLKEHHHKIKIATDEYESAKARVDQWNKSREVKP